MTNTPTYGWSWFRDEIQKGVAFSERYCRGLLDLVEEMDLIVGALLARPTSPMSDRPQDYVVSVLVTRAFRLTISSLYLGLGGYPDSATNFQRTVWEIGIRLLDMTTAPVAAALGFLLDGAASEVSQVEAELDHRQRHGLPVHLLPRNLETLRAHYERLGRLARDRDLDPEAVRRAHGRLNVREVCRRFGVEKAYLVDYALTTGYVHEKNLATSDYVIERPDERQFHLGPVGVPGGPVTIAIDVLNNVARLMTIATLILQDGELTKRADELQKKLVKMRETLESQTG